MAEIQSSYHGVPPVYSPVNLPLERAASLISSQCVCLIKTWLKRQMVSVVGVFWLQSVKCQTVVYLSNEMNLTDAVLLL